MSKAAVRIVIHLSINGTRQASAFQVIDVVQALPN